MEDDVITLLLAHRDRLNEKIEELKAQLRPLREEMNKVQQALHVVGYAATGQGIGSYVQPQVQPPELARRQADHARRQYVHKMTMKQLVIFALHTEFPNGATSQELLKFFRLQLDRFDIKRESLSPQLSRLKTDEVIDLIDGSVWKLRSEQAVPDDAATANTEANTPGPKGDGGGEMKTVGGPRPPTVNPFL